MANAQRDNELHDMISLIKEPKSILSLDNGGELAEQKNEGLLKYLMEIDEYSNRILTLQAA